MAKARQDQIDIDLLDGGEADRRVRQVLLKGGLKQGDEPPPSAETRRSLLEVLQDLEQGVESPVDTVEDAAGEIAKQSLRVLAQDPAFGPFLSSERLSRGPGSRP